MKGAGQRSKTTKGRRIVKMDGNDCAVRFIQTLEIEKVPSSVLRHAKVCLLDLVGASIAGADARGARILSDFCSRQMKGAGEATVIGTKRKVSCVAAALVNGFIANALDIDDGYRKIKGHPGAAVFPTVLALSEKIGARGKEFLEALIVGYEIGIRAGEILHDHYGFYHGSGSWGAIASAAAGSRLLRLSGEQTKNALGIAEAYAPLIPEIRAVEHPAMAPKDGINWGAMVGTSATFLAQEGYTATPSLLGDGKRNRDVFTLGKTYRMMNLYFKRYPCCRWAHPAIDGILAIMTKESLNYKGISRITVHSFSEAVSLFSTPPTSMENAEFNLCYPVAVAAIYGEFTPKYLQEKYFQGREIVQLMKKVQVIKDPAIQKKFPARCLGEVEVLTKRGRRYRSGVIAARGDYDYPVSEGELEEKFLLMTRERLGEKRAMRCMRLVKEFERHRTKDLIDFLE